MGVLKIVVWKMKSFDQYFSGKSVQERKEFSKRKKKKQSKWREYSGLLSTQIIFLFQMFLVFEKNEILEKWKNKKFLKKIWGKKKNGFFFFEEWIPKKKKIEKFIQLTNISNTFQKKNQKKERAILVEWIVFFYQKK